METDALALLLGELYRGSNKPSQDRSRVWIFEASPSCSSFYSDGKSGKWCIFAKPEAVDAAWNKVKAALKRDELLCAKVSTLGSLNGRKHHVICVYTRDWSDQVELQRTREVLRQLGFTEELGYKRDVETMNGVYGPDEWFLRA